MREEAAAKGVPTVIWSYPRGEDLSKDGETAIDVGAYAAQIAALLGAHIIKVKLSTDHLEQGEAKKVYEKHKIDISTQAARVRHCVQAAFDGRRIVVFSGGAAKGEDAVYEDARGDPRRRRQRLDHRAQHLPAQPRGRDGDAGQAGRDLQGPRLGCVLITATARDRFAPQADSGSRGANVRYADNAEVSLDRPARPEVATR